MRGGIAVNVTRDDRRRLEAIVADRSAPQKHVWRANIILATADGFGAAEIMRPIGQMQAGPLEVAGLRDEVACCRNEPFRSRRSIGTMD